ncbi:MULTISPECIES: DUF6773 family protein [Bacillus]|uniref:Uncharacterized protein n=1 Tax=Bacillus wiedmannii TaxID=1890302 RepID=A0AB37YSV7_9BACI|nr:MULTISPECIES: DUF6773 family protein [Bacillus]EJS66067.1 hypothetical protein ICW_03773 [Bacillus wiedmannii]EJV66846.1 hypothetical protein IEO_01435 [Bacillus wiedmannii]MDR4942779.1 hypothetical protein [Bacillus wiedmannii]MED3318803.1 hypothetical protein [Bacillus wiedmannii]OFD11051.1 hypothetical protein BTGOE6_13200 [Bacillus wiedmannii]
MEKLKKWFSLSIHSDERIQKIEMKIWAQSGIVVLLLAFIDIIIRGTYLHRPFLEWIASLAIIICYMIFFFIKSILTGVYETDINNKEQLKEKMSDTFILCFVAIGATTYKYNLPEDFVGWLSVIAKFITLFIFLFGIQYLITVIAWKRSNKI